MNYELYFQYDCVKQSQITVTIGFLHPWPLMSLQNSICRNISRSLVTCEATTIDSLRPVNAQELLISLPVSPSTQRASSFSCGLIAKASTSNKTPVFQCDTQNNHILKFHYTVSKRAFIILILLNTQYNFSILRIEFFRFEIYSSIL